MIDAEMLSFYNHLQVNLQNVIVQIEKEGINDNVVIVEQIIDLDTPRIRILAQFQAKLIKKEKAGDDDEQKYEMLIRAKWAINPDQS